MKKEVTVSVKGESKVVIKARFITFEKNFVVVQGEKKKYYFATKTVDAIEEEDLTWFSIKEMVFTMYIPVKI